MLIVVAAITLALGWVGAKEPLIWTSIVASVGAAVLLSLGLYRSKKEASVASASRPDPGPRADPPAGGQEQVPGGTS